MKTYTLVLMVALVLVGMTLGSCHSLSPVQSSLQDAAFLHHDTRIFGRSSSGGDNVEAPDGTIIVIEGVSPNDYSQLFERRISNTPDNPLKQFSQSIASEKVDIVLYRDSNMGVYFRLSRVVDGRREFALINYYLAYDASRQVALVKASREAPRASDYRNFQWSDEALIQAVADRLRDSLQGYRIVLNYAASGRAIAGAASGGISLDIVMDALSEITVGGLKAKTDAEGHFSFSGKPSLARVVEGIVTLTDASGRKVLAQLNEANGQWIVVIQGVKAGKPETIILSVKGLESK